jgi:hypothetical protein
MLRKTVCVICVAICGAQADVSPANDTESSFNVEGARGQLRGVAKGKEFSGITLRSGMAVAANCDIAAEYSFNDEVAIGSGCNESACQDQEMVQSIRSASHPNYWFIEMIGVYYDIREPSGWISIDSWNSWYQDADWSWGFTLQFRCEEAKAVQVEHLGWNKISVAAGWKVVLTYSTNVTAVRTDQHGNGGRVDIGTGGPNPYIESVTFTKPTGQPELRFAASIRENSQCEHCPIGPAMYFTKKKAPMRSRRLRSCTFPTLMG